MTLLVALVVLPALAALGAYAHQEKAYRTVWLVAVAVLHLGLVGAVALNPPPPALGGWIAADALGLVVLGLVSAIFLAVALTTVGYLRREDPRGGRAFVSCLLAFLSAASLVAVSHHFALLWIGMEATTLAVAPLIFHRHDRRSLEAVWKYLVMSSVAIALALLGTFFLATAQSAVEGTGRPLVLEDLIAAAPLLHPAWLKGAFVFLLVGFGTKMGLAPLHTWKPDTYGEAPSMVSGLMASALTSCAFLGVARIMQVAVAAGIAAFARPPLIAFGVFSMGLATVFIVGQRDIKRMLAYSSIEHMGLLVLGLGLGGVGAYGTVLHVINNAITKTLVFLATGNIVQAAGTSNAADIRGLVRTVPVSGVLLLVGIFAITGSPPFGPFLSMFTILNAASSGHPWITVAMVLLLAIVFVGLATMVLGMLLGEPASALRRAPAPTSVWLVGGPIALAALSLALGLYLPQPLQRVLAEAAASLGGHAP
jgi:hydrogenase-4 component F